MNVKVGGTTMNKWKEFAEILELELEQEFVLTDVDGNTKGELTYKFTEDGLLCKPPTLVNWSKSSSGTILRLLNGDYKVASKPWKPKYEEKYWYYSYVWEEASCITWYGSFLNLLLWKVGNCFKTEEEAATKGKEIMEKIQKEYDEA